MPKSDKPFYRLMASDRLPAWLAWVIWAIAAILTIAGYAIGSIASDLWGYVLNMKRKRNRRE